MNPLAKCCASRISLALAIVVVFSGCGTELVNGKAPPSPSGLFQAIGSGNIMFYRWENGPSVMICSDIKPDSTSSGENLNGPPWVRKEEGFVSTEDGRKLEWRLEKRVGRKVTCRLNEKEFDLDKGNLFLVKTKGGETEIEQVSQDLSALTLDYAGVEEFARKNPAVSKLIGLGDE